ncbi:MAG TPA: HlyD family secretion protein [Gemmatimonadaceae bacterium]|jgi:membrane fusion protein (multidrug efflux system)|nr:HlyD family secretion protein [Gemmatimonadaceae bacterium]
MATPINQSEPTSTAVTPSGNGSRRWVRPIIVVILLVALGWGVKAYLYARAHVSTDDAQVEGNMTPVLAKVGGYVQRLTVDDNQHVAGDSLLVQIDTSEYALRLLQAQAELAAARAAVTGPKGEGQAQAAVQGAISHEASLDAQIGAAQAEVTKTAADLARARELVAKQIVSKQQLDAAQAAADAAAASLQALRKQQVAAGSGVVAARAGVRLAEARLAAAQAAVVNARLQLSYTHVRAPMAGQVSRKQVEVGQLVQPGQPLMTIVSDTGVWIVANYKETQLTDIHVGEAVELEVDAYPGCEAEGSVESIAAATGAMFSLLPPDNATGNFTKVVQRVPVRIAVKQGCGPNRPLRPGMSVVTHVNSR